MDAPPLDARYVPDVLPNPAADVAYLLSGEVAWDSTMRARQTACFGVPYDYSGRRHEPVPMPARIAAMADLVASVAAHPFNNCLVNRYETGLNTMGFHRDSYEGLVPNSSIAIVSLGATRTLAFRSADRLRRAEIALAHGSLLLMTEVTQQHWTHAVPRAPGAERRFSLTFRWFDNAAADARR